MNAGIKMRIVTRKKPDYTGVNYSAHTRFLTFVEERENCYITKDQTGMQCVVPKNDLYFDLISVEFTK